MEMEMAMETVMGMGMGMENELMCLNFKNFKEFIQRYTPVDCQRW